jgi:hypothetical protein
MKQFIERATRKAVEIERLLDDRMNALVGPRTRSLEPLEIRNAILRDIAARVVPGPQGTHVFPYDEMTIELLEQPDAANAAIEAMFDGDGGLASAARTRLSDQGCRLPAALSIQVTTVAPKPDDWPADEPYRLRFRRMPQRQKANQEPTPLVLTLSPQGWPKTFTLLEDCINIGRVEEVRDREGQLVRRNLVVIADVHDPKTTVSRRHAHISAAPDPDGRLVYRLYDDASRYGTRVVRKGRTIPVHPGTLGIRLRDGDELHFGAATAVVKLES